MPANPEPNDAPADLEVITKVLKGETSLFEVLMRRYNQRLYRVARSILGNTAEAEDVVQATWSQVYANLHQYAGAASFVTWASTIAANDARRRITERARFGRLGTESEPFRPTRLSSVSGTDPERRAFHGELRTALEAAIDSLQSEYRSVFVLRCIEHMNVHETAEVLGVSDDIVKTRLHRARLKLRKSLGQRLGAVPPDLYRFRGAHCDRVVRAMFRTLSKSAA